AADCCQPGKPPNDSFHSQQERPPVSRPCPNRPRAVAWGHVDGAHGEVYKWTARGQAHARDQGRRAPEPSPAIDHLNSVRLDFGANTPSRVPRRTNNTGAGAAFAISERVGP